MESKGISTQYCTDLSQLTVEASADYMLVEIYVYIKPLTPRSDQHINSPYNSFNTLSSRH